MILLREHSTMHKVIYASGKKKSGLKAGLFSIPHAGHDPSTFFFVQQDPAFQVVQPAGRDQVSGHDMDLLLCLRRHLFTGPRFPRENEIVTVL
jgi:hypothetical protein